MPTSKRKKVIKNSIIKRDGLNCCFCDVVLVIETATLEHIVPISHHGSFNRSNLTISCASCNSRRGNLDFFEYIKQFNEADLKIEKFKKVNHTNTRVNVLNLAKEKCIKNKEEIPAELIKEACKLFGINLIDINEFVEYITIELYSPQSRKKIRASFEAAITMMENEL